MNPLNNEDFSFMNDLLVIEEIKNIQEEISFFKPLTKERENRIMQKFRLEWNYNSNAIEGNSLDYGETVAFLMQGVTAKGKPLKDYLDIKGHNEAIDYLLYIIKNKEELSERDIRSLHEMLLVEPYESSAQTLDGTSVKKTIRIGEYKRMPNHVRTVTGEIHYYASPEDTPILMNELIEWYRNSVNEGKIHPAIIASIFHHRFTSIHPFDDGNGRMSRLLMNLILIQYDYPPVVIKNTEKNDYYFALSQADTGNIEVFVKFICNNLLSSLNVYLRGAKGESIEEQSDLRKKLTLFKKEVEARRDRIEEKRSPQVLNNLVEKSLLPFIADLSVVISDFKDLFFEYSEHGIGYGIDGWVYDDNSIINTFENFSKESIKSNSIKASFQFKNFKLADDSFSIELKIIFFFDELDYNIYYSFSEDYELVRLDNFYFSQWLGKPESSPKRYYHQNITSEDSKKMANKIGEEFYEYCRLIFDKKKAYKPSLVAQDIQHMWNEFTDEYQGTDSEKMALIYNNSYINFAEKDNIVRIIMNEPSLTFLTDKEKTDLTDSFFKFISSKHNSLQKIFVRINSSRL